MEYNGNQTQVLQDIKNIDLAAYQQVPYIYMNQMDYGWVYFISTKNVRGLIYDPTSTGQTAMPLLNFLYYTCG